LDFTTTLSQAHNWINKLSCLKFEERARDLGTQGVIQLSTSSTNYKQADSNSQVETATGEPLNWSRRLMDDSGFEALLRFSLHLLSSLLLVVLSLHVLELTSKSLDLVLVLIDLSLVHVQLSCHGLHLTGLFFEVLLVNGKLFGNFWSWLSSQQVLKLNIELLFLLDVDILFNDLFSLLDQSLLESLDLLEHFPGIWISTFESSPSVGIQWVLQLFGQGLDLESLSKQLLLQIVNLLSQIRDLGSLRLDNSQLTLVITDLELEETDVL